MKSLYFSIVHWFYPYYANGYLDYFKPNGFTAFGMHVLTRITAADDRVFNEGVEVISKLHKYCFEIRSKDSEILKRLLNI